jgi:hypothetical protein
LPRGSEIIDLLADGGRFMPLNGVVSDHKQRSDLLLALIWFICDHNRLDDPDRGSDLDRLRSQAPNRPAIGSDLGCFRSQSPRRSGIGPNPVRFRSQATKRRNRMTAPIMPSFESDELVLVVWH